MKIIQLINALTFGGAQIILLNLAEKLREAGHQVKIVAFKDGPLGQKLKDEGFCVTILGEDLLDLPGCIKLYCLIDDFRPDIIHSHLFKATFWARIIRYFTGTAKLITSIHGHESNYFHFLEKITSKFSDHFIFPSFYLHDWYIRNIRCLGKNNASIIYPGAKIFPPPKVTDRQIPVIATLSRLHPVKGVDRLIYAAAALKKKNLNFKILIGGDGEAKNDLIKLASTLNISDRCHFRGEITDPKAFLRSADIFVAASRQEAFGIHVSEAMERGIPVIAAKTGGLLEIIQANLTGLLFKPDSIEDLAAQLELMLTDNKLRTSLGKKARERVKVFFNRNKAIEQHMAIYNHLKPKVKIHFAVSSSELGGGERLALSLMTSFREKGCIVSATCCSGIFSEKLKLQNFQYSSTSMRCGGLFFALKMLKDIYIFSPDLINAHLNRSNMIAGFCRKFLGIPVVSHVHGLNKISYYKNTDHLIAVSDAVKEHLVKQGALCEKVSVIKNCIFHERQKPKKLIGKSLNLVIIAKLHKNKGHSWALNAILKNTHLLPELKIHLIGNGPEKIRLMQLCKQLNANGKVIFHGFQPEPMSFLNKMDVALLPSKAEGIPLSLLEAMSAGLPCIASKVGGIPEILIDNFNGFLVAPEDEKGLVKALNRIADGETYQKFSERTIEKFKRINNFPEMVAKTETIFCNFINK
jgi:glycosyltransferase involved in cell wall biosynthesis